MTASPAKAVLSFVFVLCLTATSVAAAQTAAKPLFTVRPWLCIGGGFVAMVPLSRPAPLIVIKMGRKGIEAPQTFPTTGNEVMGLQCVGSAVELLVQETGSDHFSVLPFSIPRGGAIQRGQREDINYSISGKGAMPPEIERREDEFHGVGLLAGAGMRGDWYVEVPRVDNPGHIYEVHFVETESRSPQQITTSIVVTLLEETMDRKVTQSIPLIQETVSEGGE